MENIAKLIKKFLVLRHTTLLIYERISIRYKFYLRIPSYMLIYQSPDIVRAWTSCVLTVNVHTHAAIRNFVINCWYIVDILSRFRVWDEIQFIQKRKKKHLHGLFCCLVITQATMEMSLHYIENATEYVTIYKSMKFPMAVVQFWAVFALVLC